MNTLRLLALAPCCLLLMFGHAVVLAADPAKPVPSKADVSYGPHAHQLLDVYLPHEGKGPFPVVIWFGGLWKPSKGAPVGTFLPKQCAVVAVETRVMQDAIDAKLSPPVSACLLDARRAVQFVRLHAAEWQLDPQRIAVAGGSQGTLPALYVGCAGEKADPKSADPVERVSTKVTCVGAFRSQPSIDPQQMQEWEPGVEWGAPALGYSFPESLQRREELLPLIKQWSPDALVSKDAPPIYFENEWGLTQPEGFTETNYKVHSPRWALGFQKIARERGATCYAKFLDHPTAEYADIWDFLLRQVGAGSRAIRVVDKTMAAALQPLVDRRRLGGAVAVVATKDRVLCFDAFGFADVETKRRMQIDDEFWIASMTKSMTAAALMMLVDEGKVNIDDPAEKYLPEFKHLAVADSGDDSRTHKPRHPVTLKELFSHTHGMREVKTDTVSLQDDITAFTAVPAEAEPGTRFKYSNVSLNVAGRIIEVASGMSYADFMQQRLFTPLAMTDTTFWPDRRQVDRLVRTFRQTADKQGIENVTFEVKYPPGPVPPALLLQYNGGMVPIYRNRYAHPSGGIYSTAADVLKFCQMLLNGGTFGGKRYLSEAAIQQMASIQTGDIPVNPQEGYGLGWFVQKKEATGHPSVGSYGHRGARKTVMWIDPAKQLVMILMMQSFDLSGEDQEAIYGAFIGTAEAMSPKK